MGKCALVYLKNKVVCRYVQVSMDILLIADATVPFGASKWRGGGIICKVAKI